MILSRMGTRGRYLLAGIAVVVVVATIVRFWPRSENPVVSSFVSDVTTPTPVVKSPTAQTQRQDVRVVTDGFFPPLPRSDERVTKKPFGIYITKATSPVQPERFSGYHTGTDFETFPDEADADVPVSAVCPGRLLSKRTASGYGGIAVQSCTYGGQPVTVVYGHLRLSSIAVSVGETLQPGEFLGYLGTGFSTETDGERKHLHLGIHKGTAIDIPGYVASKGKLSGWIDACPLVCKGGN